MSSAWRAKYLGDVKWRFHFQFWGCILKGYFEKGIIWRAKSRLKGIKDFNHLKSQCLIQDGFNGGEIVTTLKVNALSNIVSMGGKQRPGRLLGIIGWGPSLSKSNRLHFDIFQFSFIELGYIP